MPAREFSTVAFWIEKIQLEPVSGKQFWMMRVTL